MTLEPNRPRVLLHMAIKILFISSKRSPSPNIISLGFELLFAHTSVVNPTDLNLRCALFTEAMITHTNIHTQTHISPHCFDCILSTICLFNQPFLRTYVCFLRWQVQTASCSLLSIFHQLSFVSKKKKKTHGQLSKTLGLGTAPWSGL